MINVVASEICIDMDSLYLHGYSNGGMLTHGAYQDSRLAGMFKVVIPVCGNPLGRNGDYVFVPAANSQTSILSIHSRSDRIIPDEGGLAGGWYYASTNDMMGAWASRLGCNSSPTTISTSYDGGSKNTVVTEWKNCNGGQRVVKVLVNGGHCAVPNQEEELQVVCASELSMPLLTQQ